MTGRKSSDHPNSIVRLETHRLALDQIVQIDKWSRGMTVENLTDATAATLLIELSSDVMAENIDKTIGFIEKAAKGEPDVILLDLSMPLLGGIDVCQRLKQLHPSPGRTATWSRTSTSPTSRPGSRRRRCGRCGCTIRCG